MMNKSIWNMNQYEFIWINTLRYSWHCFHVFRLHSWLLTSFLHYHHHLPGSSCGPCSVSSCCCPQRSMAKVLRIREYVKYTASDDCGVALHARRVTQCWDEHKRCIIAVFSLCCLVLAFGVSTFGWHCCWLKRK